MRNRTWTRREWRILRRRYGHESTRELATRLHRTPLAVRQAAKKLRLTHCRRWNPADLEVLRRDYGTVPGVELARRLGIPLKRLHTAAKRHGLTDTYLRLADVEPRLRELVALKWCNRCIARDLGSERHVVCRWRVRLGLPSVNSRGTVATCKPCIDKIKATTARQCEKAGVPNLGHLRRLSYQRYAERNGWPSDLRPRAVQILNLLAHAGVPLNRRQIADGIGMEWKGSRKSLVSNDPEGSYLAHRASGLRFCRPSRIARTLWDC